MSGELRKKKPLYQAAIILISAVTLFAVVFMIAIIFSIHIYTSLIYLIEAVIVLMLIYAIFVTARTAWSRRSGALLMIFINFIFLMAALHDIFYHNNYITSILGKLAATVFFILMFFLSFILTRKFSQAYREVSILSGRLLSMNKLKNEFLANTSHELKTPLSGIISLTESVLQGTEGEVNPKQRETLSLVVSSARRLSHLVNDVLDYSRLKNGDIFLDKKAVDLVALAESVLAVHRYMYSHKEIEFVNGIPQGLPPVYADEGRLTQVMYNLVGNAAKFSEAGWVKVSAVQKKKIMEVSVEDTGIGIPKDKFADIFQFNEQPDASVSRKYGGTGLGLGITKQLVELHGGEISLTSQVGRGSCFSFTIPVFTDGLPEESSPAPVLDTAVTGKIFKHVSPEESVINPEGSGTILVVDDDYINLRSITGILKLDGYRMILVSDPRKAVETAAANPALDLVILDVMMPGMSGYEVCRKIREMKQASDLPVLMLTAKSQHKDLMHGFDAGANDFLAKPFEAGELRVRVKTLVDLKKSVETVLKTEAAFLQAQINPHFLFNTLNTIAVCCETDSPQAGELILQLATYLRESFDLSNLETLVPLEKEINMVQAYTAIEMARFKRIKVEYQIEACLDVMIPPLIIQPVVENAIRHGIGRKKEGGTVWVSARVLPAGLEITIRDDGVGMPAEEAAAVGEQRSLGGSIGLYNINARLKKFFGTALKIKSSLGAGTVVIILIPDRR